MTREASGEVLHDQVTTRSRPLRRVAGCAAAALAFVLTGCSGGSDDPDPTTSTTPDDTSSATPAPSDDPAAIAAIQAQYAAYWAAVVASENGPDPDPKLFEGVADGPLVEEQIGRAAGMADDGIHRVGEPTIAAAEVNVKGRAARAEACVDQTDWGLVHGDDPIPVDGAALGPRPYPVDLRRVGDVWLVVKIVPEAEATITC
ncbi:MAG TPA: hypothetical protein VIP77_03145 [Jiangellaceae bacterium]